MYRVFLIVFLCLGGLSGCLLDPFVDTRSEAGTMLKVGDSTKDNPVVCYNSWFTEPEEVAKMAEEECRKTERHAYFKSQRSFSCRFFIPSKAKFECK